MNALIPLWHDILLVWTFFTRIPAPHFMTSRTLANALWALPFISLVVASVQFLGFLLITWIFGESAGWVLGTIWLVVSPIVLTGALHWDGLADVADGLGVDKNRRVEVMRDSTVGAFAVLALIAVFMTQLGLFAELRKPNLSFGFLPLLFIALLSRQFMVFLWAKLPAADSASQASRLGTPDRWLHGGLFVAFILLAWLCGVLSLWAIFALCVFTFAWGGLIWHWLDGINGDGLGATQVATETFLLILVVASLG